MAQDINGQYTGKMLGKDRQGHTTPDLEAGDHYRPWLPVPYPAPWLPALRQDQGHPILASVVLSSQHLVGQDKSGALVPSGLFCGKTPAGSNKWCIITYSAGLADEFTIDPRTGNAVTPGDHVVFAAPADAAPGNVTLPSGVVVSVTQTDINWAWECNLFPSVQSGTSVSAGAGSTVVVPIIAPSTLDLGSTVTFTLDGLADKLSGTFSFAVSASGTLVPVTIAANSSLATAQAAVAAAVAAAGASAAGVTAAVVGNSLVLTGPVDTVDNGINTFVIVGTLAGSITAGDAIPYSYGVVRPIGVATRNVLQYIGGVKLLGNSPLVGGILYALQGLNPLGFQVMNYMHEMGTAIQTQYVLRVPWIGAAPNTLQQLATQDGIQGFVQGYGRSFAHYTGNPQIGNGVTFSQANGDAGNYSDFNPQVHTPVDLIGRIIGIMNMIYKIGYSNRVKTLWDPSRMVGPIQDPNPASIMMGGSATGGLPYHLNLTTDGIYKASLLQKKPAHAEYGTYVLVRVNL